MHFCDFLNHRFGGIMLCTLHSAQVWGSVKHLLQVIFTIYVMFRILMPYYRVLASILIYLNFIQLGMNKM